MNKTFGENIRLYRQQKGWTVKRFIEELGNNLSATYITKIEIHEEIPSPELTCKIEDIFGLKEQQLLKIAKKTKVKQYRKSLDEKYSVKLD